MAQLRNHIPTSTAVPARQREVSVLVMLIAVPVIWTVLLAPMIGLSLEAVVTAVGLAGFAGLIAGVGHEFYLDRDGQLRRQG